MGSSIYNSFIYALHFKIQYLYTQSGGRSVLHRFGFFSSGDNYRMLSGRVGVSPKDSQITSFGALGVFRGVGGGVFSFSTFALCIT